MAKRSSRRQNIIKYLLFTVVVLLVTVSLLSLFVFKYANFSTENVVLGASTGPVQASLTCVICAQSVKGNAAIILQQTGDATNWGARCISADKLSTVRYLAYITCPVPVQTRHVAPTSVHNSK